MLRERERRTEPYMALSRALHSLVWHFKVPYIASYSPSKGLAQPYLLGEKEAVEKARATFHDAWYARTCHAFVKYWEILSNFVEKKTTRKLAEKIPTGSFEIFFEPTQSRYPIRIYRLL